jgi:single-stranded-DNA-specific exonuclease
LSFLSHQSFVISLSPLWLLPIPIEESVSRKLARDLSIAPFVAELLVRRGFATAPEAACFLDPRLKALGDPFLLPDMERAVERLLAAIDRRERIVLYGDYDVDGVTSLALLTRVLRAFGAEPQCFLPLRMDEGYGLSADGAARCVETHHPQLLVAVDCGTSSATEIAALRADGVDVIVIDHHEIKGALPDGVALVNPKRGADFHYLCSVGLVFKVAHALLKRRPLAGFDLREHLDLVALGTVADLVPLVAENRILVKRGLEQLATTRWIGLRALMEVAVVRAPLTPSDVGFKLGPRMNAAGRLGTAEEALELLLTDDASRARTIALDLDRQNRERRAVEDDVFTQAETQLGEWFQPERDAAIVVGADGWHPGVVGIVASRLLRRHHRPALVIGFDECGVGKGSGRSIDGLSLVQALTHCGPLLEKYGGHEMAAGLTLRRERFVEFREAFRACASQLLSAEQLQPRLRLDAELTLGDIHFELLAQHGALQPFGMGNRQPTFFARGVTLAAEPRVMKEKHLSLLLHQGGDEYRAVWFGSAAEVLPRLPWDVAFEIERNEYQGSVSAQIHIKAVRSAQ